MADDVRTYLRHADGWAPVENETNQTIERILRTEFVDQAEVSRQIADNRPAVLAHLQVIRAYAPATPAVQAVHREYVAAWERLLAAYAAVEGGFADARYERVSEGRAGMLAWRQGLVAVARELRRVAGENGVAIGEGA